MAIMSAIRPLFAATRCSGLKISRKCHFFSFVFKVLTDVRSVSHCKIIKKRCRENSRFPLTVDGFGHNLMHVRTQHLVSKQ